MKATVTNVSNIAQVAMMIMNDVSDNFRRNVEFLNGCNADSSNFW